jgi:hypothetical protein
MTKANVYTVIKFIAGFILLIFGFSYIVDFGVRKSESDQLGKVNRIAEHKVDPDLIVFGSSVGEVGINTPLLSKELKVSAFNCSIDGTRFQQYQGLMKEFLSYSTKNKIVCLVETYFSFEPVDALTSIERYTAQLCKDSIFKPLYAIQPDLAWKSRYVPLYKYIPASNVYYKNALIGWKNFLGYGEKDTLLGYTPIYQNWQRDADSIIQSIHKFSAVANGKIILQYQNVIQQFKNKGRKVFIIFPPVYKRLSEEIVDLTILRKALAEVAHKTGAVFLDYSNASGYSDDKKLFYNGNHMNGEGSSMFTRKLADTLKRLSNGI